MGTESRYSAMAKLLENKLTYDEMTELVAVMDGDAEDWLLDELKAIDAQRRPELYVTPEK